MPEAAGEVRVDPLTGLRTIVAPVRAGRPASLAPVAAPPPIDPAGDPFAAGNEDRTPPALLEVPHPDGEPGTWAVRVVPNLYPAITPDAPAPEPTHRPDLYIATPAAGVSEVIVNAPDPVHSLAQLGAAQVALAVDTWRARMRAHPDAAYVHLHVNEQAAGGATQPHTHAQLLALPFVPALVARERERFGAYATRTMGGDLLSDLLQEEVRGRTRIVAIDDEAVLLAPYASATPYRLMLVPRRGRARFEDDGPSGAALLHDALLRLTRRFGATPPLTLWVRTAPQGADRFCWHIEIAPRLTALAGLELGTGVHLNPVAPEQAAAELRDA